MDRLADLVLKGLDQLLDAVAGDALALADLNRNLLRFRGSEYAGLDALAAHLQTVFGECECSIFRAVKVRGGKVRLYLAATSALSGTPQHQAFRNNFFRDYQSYASRCRALQSHSGRPATAAYHDPSRPVLEAHVAGGSLFSGCGEWAESTSFLALAIPSSNPGEPYGVVRLVRGGPPGTAHQTPASRLRTTACC